MPIDLGTSPTGTPPTAEEKTQILSALGIGDTATRSGAETLTNKTITSPVFAGISSGQLDLPTQTTATESSLINRTMLKRELVYLRNAVQRFNVYRTLSSRGGLNSASIGRSGTTYTDNIDAAQLSMSTASFDHTSWAEHNFGACYVDNSSGATLSWLTPFSFAFKVSGVQFNAASLAVFYLGVSGPTQNGVPITRGVGLSFSKDGYRMWAHSGVTYAATGVASTDIITAVGHNFIDGDVIQFSALTGGTNLTTATRYFVINVSGNNFQLSNTSGGPVLDFTTNITAATIPQLPTFSSVIAGLPSITLGFQSVSSFLITNNGLGTASLFYGAFNSAISNTAISTIAIPSSGTTIASMRLNATSNGSYSSTTSALGVVTTAFAPF